MGEHPVFLTRGHGGSAAGPLLVDPARHSAREVGDEPLLLARHAPTVVARARRAGAELAKRHGGVVVMDDGLQNPSLVKDLAFAVVDARVGVGNGLCLPAGPLRAPLAAQWPLADALVLIGEGTAGDGVAREADRLELPVIRAEMVPDRAAAALKGRRVVAFAGIGHPEKFFATLRGIGAAVVAEHGFADHHDFTASELAGLAREAVALDAILVTTEKDMMRIGDGRSAIGRVAELRALSIGLRIAQPPLLDRLLAEALASRPRG